MTDDAPTRSTAVLRAGCLGLLLLLVGGTPSALAQASGSQGAIAPKTSGCPPPVLSRLKQHTVAPGETVQSIAQNYNLIPATLLGMNPALRQRQSLQVGTQIYIPPYNGIFIETTPGQSLKEIAAQYNVRPDVLFEVNGCQTTARYLFVPGVNWSPVNATTNRSDSWNMGYPLPATGTVVDTYGWRVVPASGAVEFNSGIDLATRPGTAVVAVAAGTVAFSGDRTGQGKVVIVNHAQGRQTRYSQLAQVRVQPGQQVTQGQVLGTVGTSSAQPVLHFELRQNSSLGWVAQDPTPYWPQQRRP